MDITDAPMMQNMNQIDQVQVVFYNRFESN